MGRWNDDEWNNSQNTIEHSEPFVKLDLMKQDLLSELHGIGVKIGDGCITTAAREICTHIQESLSCMLNFISLV